MIFLLQQNADQGLMSALLSRFHAHGIFAQLVAIKQQHRLVFPFGLPEGFEFQAWPESVIIESIQSAKEKRFLTSRQFRDETVIHIGDKRIGGKAFNIIAGPCSIESLAQIFEIAAQIKEHGGHILRGGAFKPRTSPYDFQGLGVAGLDYLRQAADAFGLLCISEAMDIRDLEVVESKVDIIQVGARNMQNFAMLKELGKTQKPIMLKRGLSATYEEFLSAAEYVMAHGNLNIILCERGIRTFESKTRNTLDISAVPVLKDLSHLPVIIDPSHAVGIRAYVPALSYAAMACGADGVMLEVHTNPDASISDSQQTISLDTFSGIVTKLSQMAPLFDKEIAK